MENKNTILDQCCNAEQEEAVWSLAGNPGQVGGVSMPYSRTTLEVFQQALSAKFREAKYEIRIKDGQMFIIMLETRNFGPSKKRTQWV